MELQPKTIILWLSGLALIVLGWYYFAQGEKKETPSSSKPLQFMTYWFSWAPNSPEYVLSNLCQIPNGITTLMIAFALEKSDKSGLTLQLKESSHLAEAILNLKARGIKVLVSTGGANGDYPWLTEGLDEQAIAKQYIDFVTSYHFDGIDFDIEKGDLSRLPTIIHQIKQALPQLQITLTVASQGSKGIDSSFDELAAKLYLQQNLDYLILMNYDQFNYPHQLTCSYDSNNPDNNCYLRNLEVVTEQISRWMPDANAAAQLLVNGLMIGYADDGKLMTPDLAAMMTRWLKAKGYGGIMTWGLNRDQASCAQKANLDTSTGMTGLPMGAFTNRIIEELNSSFNHAN